MMQLCWIATILFDKKHLNIKIKLIIRGDNSQCVLFICYSDMNIVFTKHAYILVISHTMYVSTEGIVRSLHSTSHGIVVPIFEINVTYF